MEKLKEGDEIMFDFRGYDGRLAGEVLWVKGDKVRVKYLIPSAYKTSYGYMTKYIKKDNIRKIIRDRKGKVLRYLKM